MFSGIQIRQFPRERAHTSNRRRRRRRRMFNTYYACVLSTMLRTNVKVNGIDTIVAIIAARDYIVPRDGI